MTTQTIYQLYNQQPVFCTFENKTNTGMPPNFLGIFFKALKFVPFYFLPEIFLFVSMEGWENGYIAPVFF